MKNAKLRIVIAVLLVVGAAFYFAPSNQEAVIRARISELESLITINAPEQKLEALGKATEISKYFTKEISVQMITDEGLELKVFGSKELKQKLIILRTRASKIEFKLDIQDIEIEDEQATLKVKAAALGSLQGVEGEFFDLHLVEIQMAKVDGEWLISKGSHIENLRN